MVTFVGILVSGRGSNMEAILDASKAGRLGSAQVNVVISNRKDAPALEKASRHGVKVVVLDDLPYKGRREEYEKLLCRRLFENGVTGKDGLVVLAGFMRILSPWFVKQFEGRIMNIHPSLLPSFPGLDAQRKALEQGVKITGCTVHFATEDVDAGPIVLQAAVDVHDNDTVEEVSERILREEHRIYPEAVRLFSEGRLRVEGRKVTILK